MTQGEYNIETSGGHGVVQFGTTAVTGLNFATIKFHEATILTSLYVDGNTTDVRDKYHLEGTGGSYPQGAIIRPRKDLGHKFFSGIAVDTTGSGEGVLSDKKK